MATDNETLQPANPNIPDKRKQKPRGFLDVLRENLRDPAVQQGFARFGSAVTQPMQPGVTPFSSTINALEQGFAQTEQARAQQTEQEQAQRRVDIAEQRTDISSRRADIAERQADQQAESIQLRRNQLEEEVRRNKLMEEAELDAMRALAEQRRAAANRAQQPVGQTDALIDQTTNTLRQLNPNLTEPQARMFAIKHFTGGEADNKSVVAEGVFEFISDYQSLNGQMPPEDVVNQVRDQYSKQVESLGSQDILSQALQIGNEQAGTGDTSQDRLPPPPPEAALAFSQLIQEQIQSGNTEAANWRVTGRLINTPDGDQGYAIVDQTGSPVAYVPLTEVQNLGQRQGGQEQGEQQGPMDRLFQQGLEQFRNSQQGNQ